MIVDGGGDNFPTPIFLGCHTCPPLPSLLANLLLCHENVTRRFPAPNHKLLLVNPLPPSEEEIEVALRNLTLVTGQDRSALLRNMILRELQFALPPMNNFPQNNSERSYLSPV